MGRDEAMREPLDWERAALAAGVDPAHVWARRDLEERLHDRTEALVESIYAGTEAVAAAIEKASDEDDRMAALADVADPAAAFEAWRDVSIEALRFLTLDPPRRTDA